MARLFSFFSIFLAVLAATASGKSVTYPGIGTFNSQDFYDPVHRPFTVLFLPQSPKHISPEFILFTRGTREHGETIQWNNTESARRSHFDGSKETKVVIHGLIDNQLFAVWMKNLKDRYLDYQDVNVLLVYWPKGNFFPYGQAAVNTRVVGPMVAIQITTFCKAKGTTPASFHIIGHSLGAHIGGNAGKFLGNSTLGRITGLDLAGPYFEGLPSAARLWHTDAQFVDSIHTDARPLTEAGFGMYETCSHLDFYPNGGKVQPGCTQERLTAGIFNGLFEGTRRLVACNHQRAVDYFIASLNATAIPLPKAYQCGNYEDFKAGKCIDCGSNGEKCAILGPRATEHSKVQDTVNQGVNGRRFFMITDHREPFLNKYQYILRLKLASTGPKQFEKEASVQIRFVDNSGHKETFSFDGKTKLKATFKLGQSTTHPGAMSVDPENLKRIDIEWDSGLLKDIFDRSLMHIDQIEVLGLTEQMSTTKSKPLNKRFCRHSMAEHGIKSKTPVSFEQC